MLKELIKLANDLDRKGLTAEADVLDKLIRKAQTWPWDQLKGQRADNTESNQYSSQYEVRGVPMDDVERQEEAAKKKAALEHLRPAERWIAENLYYSTEDGASKFPLTAEVELNFGPHSKDTDARNRGWLLSSMMPKGSVIVPKGTVFESLSKAVLTKNHGTMNLRQLNDNLNKAISEIEKL